MSNKYMKFKKCKTLLIKMDENIPTISKNNEMFQILVKFKTSTDDQWNYHIPQRGFSTQDQIIKYFLANQESDWLKVKVKRLEEKGL